MQEKTPEILAGMVIAEYFLESLKEGDRVRVEDFISAAAAVVGERCMEAAADFDPRDHTFVVGARVFSTRVNELFCGDASDLNDVPSDTIVGRLRDLVVGNGFEVAHFPQLQSVFETLPSKINGPEDVFGFAPLSVPEEHRPFNPPLQVEFETRDAIDQILRRGGLKSPDQRLHGATCGLARVLIMVSDAIDPRLALQLALETVNGMAKTAPMTKKEWANLAGKVKAEAKPERARPWWRFWG